MKKFLFIILASVIPCCLTANEKLLMRADSAYMADNFDLAAGLYKQAADSIGTSSSLFYNLGNTYYRMNDLGHAIVYYERALQLDPTNSDARTNLDFVNSIITDKPLDSGSFLSDVIDSIVSSAHYNTWAWTTFVLFVIILICVVGYIFSSGIRIRKICFFGGIVLMFVTLATASFAWMGARNATDHRFAVIIVSAAQLSTTPRTPTTPSEQAFLLHEGTKLEIVDSVASPGQSASKWYEVKVSNTHRAWINSDEIEKI